MCPESEARDPQGRGQDHGAVGRLGRAKRVVGEAEFLGVRQTVAIGVGGFRRGAEGRFVTVIQPIVVGIERLQCGHRVEPARRDQQDPSGRIGNAQGTAGISAPGDQVTRVPQSHRVVVAGLDLDDAIESLGHPRLAVPISSPRHDGAVGAEGHGVGISGGDGDHVLQAGRDFALSRPVVAPADHPPVVPEGDGMAPSGRDGPDVLQVRRHLELSVVVGAPGRDGAIGEQGQAVVAAGGDGRDGSQEIRCGGLSGSVPSPACDAALGIEGQRVVAAGGHGHHAVQGGRCRQFALGGVSPTHHGAVGEQRQRVPGPGADLAEGSQPSGHGGLTQMGITPGDDLTFDGVQVGDPAVGSLETVEGPAREGVGESARPTGRLAVGFLQILPDRAIRGSLKAVDLSTEREALQGDPRFEAQPPFGPLGGDGRIEPVLQFNAIAEAIAVGVREARVGSQSVFETVLQTVAVRVRVRRIGSTGSFDPIGQSVGVGVGESLERHQMMGSGRQSVDAAQACGHS